MKAKARPAARRGRPAPASARGVGPAAARANGALMDGLSRTILDAMSAHIAVLERTGVILATNRARQAFGRKNLCKKFGLGHSAANLRAHLLSLAE